MAPKTHHTAVAALPPPEVLAPIQAIRRRYDRQVYRWMPHVNLLYPFLPQMCCAAAVPPLTTAMHTISAFHVTLAVFRSFTHRSGRCTIWLDPEPREPFVRLQAALQQAFPAYDEQSRFAAGFTPHLSVGQVWKRDVPCVLEALQSAWEPVRFRLTEVAVICRDVTGPFHVTHRISLGL